MKRARSSAAKAKAALESLVKTASVKPPHKWLHVAELIRDCDGIVGATATSFSVVLKDETRRVDVEDGWTEELYQFLGPILSKLDEAQLNKAMIARAVLESKLRRDGCKESETAFWLLGAKYGIHEEDWLPQQVEAKGFSVLAKELAQAVEDYRRTTPRLRIPKNAKPIFDADLGQLWVGDLLIKEFKEPAENQRLVLKSFQELGFRHRIDDPLCKKPGEPTWKRQRRRRDTIAGLNDDHVNPGIIYFKADGTGDGIIWNWRQ
jgi:hypothetical protein